MKRKLDLCGKSAGRKKHGVGMRVCCTDLKVERTIKQGPLGTKMWPFVFPRMLPTRRFNVQIGGSELKRMNTHTHYVFPTNVSACFIKSIVATCTVVNYTT